MTPVSRMSVLDKHPGVYLDTRLVWSKKEAPQMSLFFPLLRSFNIYWTVLRMF